MHTFRPGDSFYHFEIVRVLGAGYHGAVYEIRHRHTGDSFALKTMHAADCVNPGKTARALAAAKGNYRIDHRNVVQVLDLNCEADGMVWMRTELLRGYTLHELLARQGRLSLPFALAVVTEAAFGLHALHEAQIIHRDVKPSNLFYTEGRAVKVIDLSFAKVFPEGLETTVGKVGLGTPAYSAPEQLEGRGVRPDVRVEVYALGITLHELLTGRNPWFDVLDDMTELLKRQMTVMPPLLAQVARLPSRVDEVVRRAVAKDPAERYGSAMEMARALRDLSAWVTVEVQARRLAVTVPYGEPPLPGDANTWRDYRPPEPTPPRDPPAPAPPARVVLAEAMPARAVALLAATEPLLPEPRANLAGTLPLDDASIGGGSLRTVRGTELLPPEPSRPVVAPRAQARSRPEWAPASADAGAPTPRAPPPAPALRDAPATVARTQPGTRRARPALWPVVVAVVLASLGSLVMVAWLLAK
jgi:serine/threonine-protein kinase